MTLADKHDSPHERPNEIGDDYASPEDASIASQKLPIPPDWMLSKRRSAGREGDPDFPHPAAASRIAASRGLTPSRSRASANLRSSTTRASTVSARDVRTSTVRPTIAGTTRARAAEASTVDNVAESPVRVPQRRVPAKRQPAAPPAGEPSIAPQSHNRLAVPWALRVASRSAAVPIVDTQPIARHRADQSRPSPRLPAIVASRAPEVRTRSLNETVPMAPAAPVTVVALPPPVGTASRGTNAIPRPRTANAKPTATTPLVIPATSLTSALGSTELFAAAATEPVSATTVSVWRRPVTLFTAAAAVAVVVILGGTAWVASSRPVTLSAAPSSQPTEGSTGAIEDAGPDRASDRASDLPTLAQPELPLVAPIDPSLPPVTITNPNVGRGPLRPGVPAPRPSPFNAPLSFASGDATTSPRVNPAPPPVAPTTGPAESPIDPVVPAVPAAPADPVAPIDPVTPIGPVLPGDPVQPTDPVIPPIPTDPPTPTVPVVPSAPG